MGDLKIIKKDFIIEKANELREEMKSFEKKLRAFSSEVKEAVLLGNRGETIAQSIIAIRDFENSIMRLGKVIQYANDGASINDKK